MLHPSLDRDFKRISSPAFADLPPNTEHHSLCSHTNATMFYHRLLVILLLLGTVSTHKPPSQNTSTSYSQSSLGRAPAGNLANASEASTSMTQVDKLANTSTSTTTPSSLIAVWSPDIEIVFGRRSTPPSSNQSPAPSFDNSSVSNDDSTLVGSDPPGRPDPSSDAEPQNLFAEFASPASYDSEELPDVEAMFREASARAQSRIRPPLAPFPGPSGRRPTPPPSRPPRRAPTPPPSRSIRRATPYPSQRPRRPTPPPPSNRSAGPSRRGAPRASLTVHGPGLHAGDRALASRSMRGASMGANMPGDNSGEARSGTQGPVEAARVLRSSGMSTWSLTMRLCM